MKLLSLATSALLAASVSARSLSFTTQDDKLSVPGDNPLEFCADPKDNVLALKAVDLTPNPPKAGETLNITASGVLSKDVEEGATIHYSVKYGLITIINTSADLCETVKNIDLECPLKKGDLQLSKGVELPRQIPPGNYHVEAKILSVDDEEVTCLKASVEFKRGGAMGLVWQAKNDL
ncbi:related to Phosphatidylglycerol/phosphatidylinositol transfer protein [Ramularia collo-cygni]|uniref:Phosphatidylglycerol/phosphatidylinositol transfer protein n=1 Tax=Ramularia collo-cygni TaxID=112498 RepID=A0A2D3V1B0_9PEZI|nr:related to Phosphatidylglycerol/phosphatidylinositol transfer protein [Ramularia collo-cygni]CZT19270.1 related to Phosphatidylglycerol/phosphatidylinositol transfer protein [Ramularia collo-cygni]